MLDCALRLGLVGLTVSVLAGCCCPPRPCEAQADRPATLAGLPTRASPPSGEPRQIFIDVTTVRIPESQVARVLGDLQPRATNKPTAVTAAEAKTLRDSWQTDDAIRLLHAPKLLVLEGQTATVTIGETIRFAETKATTSDKGGLVFSDTGKAIGTVFLGYRLLVVAAPSKDGEIIQLDFKRFSRNTLGDLEGKSLVGLDPKTLLKHHVFEDKLDASFAVANGGFALVGAPTVLHDEDGRHIRLTLVGPRIVVGTSHASPGKAPLPPLAP